MISMNIFISQAKLPTLSLSFCLALSLKKRDPSPSYITSVVGIFRSLSHMPQEVFIFSAGLSKNSVWILQLVG